MERQNNAEYKTIGIVGGGKVGLQLFNQFSKSSISQVAYVVDINASAPAMMAAQKAGVRTYNDLQKALETRVDFIFEVTGNEKVVETIRTNADGATNRLITHEMAKIVLGVIEENNEKVKGQSVARLTEVKSEIASHLARLERSVEDIEDIMTEMNMLSINARIEAARVGELGKGFEVVATEMGKSSAAVRKITEDIEQLNAAIGLTSDRIDDSLRILTEIL